MAGYETSSCIVNGLLPYWWYNFELTASTARGESPQAAKLLRQVRTKPSGNFLLIFLSVKFLFVL